MSISNCSAAGADSMTQAITGVVSRKDKTTGIVENASVRSNGVAADAPQPVENVQGVASLSSSVMAALLSFE